MNRHRGYNIHHSPYAYSGEEEDFSSICCDYRYRSNEVSLIVLSYISILNMINELILFVLGQNDKIAQNPLQHKAFQKIGTALI